MRTTGFGPPTLAATVAILLWTQISAQTPATHNPPGGLATPATILTMHEQLRAELKRAMADGGAVGDAAKTVERTLTPHLRREEEAVLPPLGLLRALADGEDVSAPKAVLTLVQQVERDLPQLLQEHRAILDGARRLRDASERERKREYLNLADQLSAHALLNDQVLYPASILVARYLALKPGVRPTPRGEER
jgi:hypothetical protein